MTATSPVFAHHGEKMAGRPTLEQVRSWPATVSITEASSALGISPSWGYELASAGEFPCRLLTVRGRRRVLTVSLIELLSGDAEAGPAA